MPSVKYIITCRRAVSIALQSCAVFLISSWGLVSSYNIRYSAARATDSGISASALKIAIRTSFARFAAWIVS